LRFKSGQHVTFKIQDPARPAHLTQQKCFSNRNFCPRSLSLCHKSSAYAHQHFHRSSLPFACLWAVFQLFRIPRTGPLPGPETGFIATSFHSSLCRPHPASTATATATCQTIAGGNGANRRSAIAAPFFLSSGSHVAMNSKLVFRGRHSTACRSHVSAASRWGQSGS
jgi:hypothetical protein